MSKPRLIGKASTMQLRNQHDLSYYQQIAVLNREHRIYLVRHLQTGKVYVKKILDVFNPDVYRTLLTHPVSGIPRVYEFEQFDEQAVLIEEYISGRTLEELIEANCLSQARVEFIACALSDILTSLHSMNPPIIHRDIKPSNIILQPSGQVVLIDLNAARLYHAEEDPGREQDTVLLGTHGYAAPEQYGFGTSSPRTDIYALGIVIREMEESLPGHSEHYPLEQVAAKCTQLRPMDRYACAAEVKTAVKAAAAGDRPGSFNAAGHERSYSGGQNADAQHGRAGEGKKYRKFLPPGFRSGNPLLMLLAGTGYAYLCYLCLVRIPHGYRATSILSGYVFPFFAILLTVFVWADYLGIQRMAPFRKHRNRLVRFLGVLILYAILIFILMVITDIIYRSL